VIGHQPLELAGIAINHVPAFVIAQLVGATVAPSRMSLERSAVRARASRSRRSKRSLGSRNAIAGSTPVAGRPRFRFGLMIFSHTEIESRSNAVG
jgi:hypothetical protein